MSGYGAGLGTKAKSKRNFATRRRSELSRLSSVFRVTRHSSLPRNSMPSLFIMAPWFIGFCFDWYEWIWLSMGVFGYLSVCRRFCCCARCLWWQRQVRLWHRVGDINVTPSGRLPSFLSRPDGSNVTAFWLHGCQHLKGRDRRVRSCCDVARTDQCPLYNQWC